MIPRPQHTAQHYLRIMVRFQRIVTLFFGGGQKGREVALSAPQTQTPHSHTGKGEEPEPQAERSRVFQPGSKTGLIGAQAETTLATTAAPNPMPAIPPLGLKTRPPGAHALGASTQD